jgi:hypothetical protein
VSIVARPTRQLSRRGDTHAPLLCFSSPRGSLLVLGDMSEENKGDVDWAVMAEEFKKNHRPHAGHFSWETDRALAEFRNSRTLWRMRAIYSFGTHGTGETAMIRQIVRR